MAYAQQEASHEHRRLCRHSARALERRRRRTRCQLDRRCSRPAGALARRIALAPDARGSRRAPAARHRHHARRGTARGAQVLLAGLMRAELPAPGWQDNGVRRPPAGESYRPTMPLPEPPKQAAANLAPHVLTLDDDPSVRQLVRDYLVENELRVTAVATGAEFM